MSLQVLLDAHPGRTGRRAVSARGKGWAAAVAALGLLQLGEAVRDVAGGRPGAVVLLASGTLLVLAAAALVVPPLRRHLGRLEASGAVVLGSLLALGTLVVGVLGVTTGLPGWHLHGWTPTSVGSVALSALVLACFGLLVLDGTLLGGPASDAAVTAPEGEVPAAAHGGPTGTGASQEHHPNV